MQPTRSGDIDGKKVFVFDNVVDSTIIDQIHDALLGGQYTRTEVARPDTAEHKHWALELAPQAMAQSPLNEPTVAAARHFGADLPPYRIYRSYCNHAAYGDMLFIHTDCMPESRELTALWFICKEWNAEWGGETLFFNDDHDAEFVCSPRPGRLVMFDGRIPHCGRAPNRICYHPRYTLAFKLEPVVEN